MAIRDTVNSIKQHIENVYGMAEEKQAVIPANRNLANLADCVATIRGEGTYQSKEVAITVNGETIVAPDEGFDALSNVTITTNVPSGGDFEYNVYLQESQPSNTQVGLWNSTIDSNSDVIATDSIPEPTPKSLTMNNPTNLANPLLRQSELGGIIVDDYLYTFGGYQTYTSAYRYNLNTNTWETMENLPYSFAHNQLAVIGKFIYCIGTNGSMSSTYGKYNYKYDTENNTWTRNRDCPSSAYECAITSHGTDIYILGGSQNLFIKYDTINDTYTTIGGVPTSQYYGVKAVTIGDNLYLIGGTSSRNVIYKYSLTARQWSRCADIPYNFFYGVVEVIDKFIILMGSNESTTTSDIYYYDTEQNTWTRITSTNCICNQGTSGIKQVSDSDFDIYVVYNKTLKKYRTVLHGIDKLYDKNTLLIQQDNFGVPVPLIKDTDYDILAQVKDVFFYNYSSNTITNVKDSTYCNISNRWLLLDEQLQVFDGNEVEY